MRTRSCAPTRGRQTASRQDVGGGGTGDKAGLAGAVVSTDITVDAVSLGIADPADVNTLAVPASPRSDASLPPATGNRAVASCPTGTDAPLATQTATGGGTLGGDVRPDGMPDCSVCDPTAPHGIAPFAGDLAGVCTPVMPCEGHVALPLPLDDVSVGSGAHRPSVSQSVCATGPCTLGATAGLGGSGCSAAPGSGFGGHSGTDIFPPAIAALPGSRWSDAPNDQCDVVHDNLMFDYE